MKNMKWQSKIKTYSKYIDFMSVCKTISSSDLFSL